MNALLAHLAVYLQHRGVQRAEARAAGQALLFLISMLTKSISAALLTQISPPTMGALLARHSAHTAAVSPNERSVHSCSGGLEVMEAGWDL